MNDRQYKKINYISQINLKEREFMNQKKKELYSSLTEEYKKILDPNYRPRVGDHIMLYNVDGQKCYKVFHGKIIAVKNNALLPTVTIYYQKQAGDLWNTVSIIYLPQLFFQINKNKKFRHPKRAKFSPEVHRNIRD